MTITAKKEYQWAENFNYALCHTDVKKVIQELEAIQRDNKKITPELIVKNARNKNSVMHDYFEWNNEKAANAWRLRQAAYLIANIEVKEVSNGEVKTMRVFEITKRGFGQSVTELNKVDNIEDNPYFLSYIIGDLSRCKNKLNGVVGYEKPLEFITKAIELLSTEESTETAKGQSPLAAVG